MMAVVKMSARLNAESWTEALAALPRGRPAADEHVLIDLTDVRFADFVTLGHLLVFVRSIAEAGVECSVWLPAVPTPRGDTQHDPNVALGIMRRHNCRLYLEQTGVVEALGAHVVAPPTTVFDGPLSAVEGEPPLQPIRAERPHRYRRILPYRWLPVGSITDMMQTTELTEPERALRELGLRSETAAAVTRGVLHELLENAAVHSTATHVLLGAVIVDPETYGSRASDFDVSLRGFAGHTAALQSPLIRLVVADTGVGAVRPGAAGGAIAAALDAWPDDTAATRAVAAQGLWKVSRVLRTYQGALLISTAEMIGGRAFHAENSYDVSRAERAALGGTIVECAVPTRPGDVVLAAVGERLTPRRGHASSHADLACFAAPLQPRTGLHAADLDAIRDLLAKPPRHHDGLVIAVNGPHAGDGADDAGIGLAIAQVADIAAGQSEVRPVFLAFPSVNRPLMAVAVEYLNTRYDKRVTIGTAVPPPVLILAPDNRHYWVGGGPDERRVLGELSSAGGATQARPISSWSALDMRAITELTERSRLLVASDGHPALWMRPQDALTAMARWAGARIADAAADAHPGDVWRDRFLTPSLRLVNTWLDLDTVLSRLNLQATAGVALAALVEDALPEDEAVRRLEIVRLEHTPKDLVAAFARALLGRDAHTEQVHDAQALDPSVRGSQRVVVVADTVSSGTTVLRAMTDIMDRGMVPIAVAAVLDAREQHERGETPDAVEFGGVSVPLLHLARVDVTPEPGDDRPAVSIDPVLRRPESGPRPVPTQIMKQEDYVGAMQRNAAARLGHIERPADRHYTAYVDPTLLFREAAWSQMVLENLTGRIRDRHQARFGSRSDAAACIMYPEGTTDDLTTAAGRLQQALGGEVLRLANSVAVPRAAHAANWQLPTSVSLPRVKHAVILDSGASSGRTVQQLVGLAADKNVEAITVVLLLNGLSDADAVNLQRIATVRRSAPEPSAKPQQGPEPEPTSSLVDLEVLYVARTAMSSLRSGHCAICALRRRYASVTLHAPVPEELAAHREWLLHTLEVRPKQVFFEEQAADLFGTIVSQKECVAYLTWRLQLRDAAVNNEHRLKVVERLRIAAGSRRIRHALIRLLVAESHWLESAPLWFDECRSLIADMSTTMLVGDGALLIEQRLRVQAAILLAHVAPERFAQELGRILRTNRNQGLVISQVAIETLLLIHPPAGAAPYSRRRVVLRLVEDLVKLLETLPGPRSFADDRSEFVTLPLVRYLLSHAQRPLRRPPGDAQEAWSELVREMSSAAHDYANKIWLVRTAVALAAAGEKVDYLDEVRDAWHVCANYLHQAILPNLAPLRQILLSKTVLAEMVPEDAVRWERTVSAGGGRAVDETTVRLDDLLERVGWGAQLGEGQTDTLLADLRWWLRFALDSDRALLPQVIARGPIEVVGIVERFFGGVNCVVHDRRPHAHRGRKLHAFCTGRLINDVFAHIRMNAEETHRLPGTDQEFQVDIDQPEPDRITVTVRNSGSTSATHGGGRGLETLDHRLARFRGTIREAPADHPWTYGVMVEMDRWRMTV